MPWHWIVIIISVIAGPFEAAYVYSKRQKRRREKAEPEAAAGRPLPREEGRETQPAEERQE